MRNVLFTLSLFLSFHSFSQLTSLPSGGNKKATVIERIGLTAVTIQYSRPGVKGREGKIWGGLVYTGFSNLGFGSAKESPWRAGANENTIISFSSGVKVEGQELPAGSYGFFIAYGPNESTIIFSKNSSSWGSYYYNESEDALRVKVKPVEVDKSNEWLKYEFMNQTDSSATVQLVWEKLIIPFKIEADVMNDQLASFRKELRSDKGFYWPSWNQAAQWCAQRNVNLEQALQWADSATSANFGGSTQFSTHVTKANILNLLGHADEATLLMKSAIPYGSVQEIHYYGRQLLSEKKTKEALEIFKMNAAKNPKQFTTLMGLARGYSGTGDYKSALKYALQAQPLAPDQANKTNVETIISKLKEGKDIN